MLKKCNELFVEGFEIIRIHTDSFWLSKKMETVRTKGSSLGQLGYEGEQEVDTELIRSRINRPS